MVEPARIFVCSSKWETKIRFYEPSCWHQLFFNGCDYYAKAEKILLFPELGRGCLGLVLKYHFQVFIAHQISTSLGSILISSFFVFHPFLRPFSTICV